MAKADLRRYEHLRNCGLSKQEVCLQARRDGLGRIACIHILQSVFDLSYGEAKRVAFAPLDEFQDRLAQRVEAAIELYKAVQTDESNEKPDKT